MKTLHPHQALAMSRQQALETLRDFGPEPERHICTLLLAGPSITEQEEIDLMHFKPTPTGPAMSVRLALARMICAR